MARFLDLWLTSSGNCFSIDRTFSPEKTVWKKIFFFFMFHAYQWSEILPNINKCIEFQPELSLNMKHIFENKHNDTLTLLYLMNHLLFSSQLNLVLVSFFRSGRLKSCALCAPVRGRLGRCCWRGRRRGAGRLGRLCCLDPRWPCGCCCCRCWRGCCCCLATLCCCCCFCCWASFLFLRFLLFLTASLTTATSSNTNRISLSFMISDFSSASFLWKKTRSQVNVLCLFQLVTLAAVLLMLKRTGGPRPGNPLYMSSYIRTGVGQFWHRLDEKWFCNCTIFGEGPYH